MSVYHDADRIHGEIILIQVTFDSDFLVCLVELDFEFRVVHVLHGEVSVHGDLYLARL